MHVTDTTAIVTGAASGLGAATTAALADAGASVYGFDLGDAIDNAPVVPGVTYVPVDVTDPVQVQDAVDRASSDMSPLRIVINCAGIGPSSRLLGRTGPHDLALYARVVQVNLVGTFNVMTLAAAKVAVTQELDDGARGVIINTASIAAFEGQVGQAAYASSKGGVVGLTLPAARDLAQYGIRVLTIAPGIVETPMLDTVSEDYRAGLGAGVPFPHRLGRPDEYAQLALALIHHDYLNGETIRMDGALRMAPR
jgi:NAD(P)-dependent dehydrogenase (short-subunit alcohol dehydrogenase family)